MKILLMATGEIAIPSFQALLSSEHEVLGLVTQPDKPVGRKQTLTPPKVKEIAEEAGLLVLQPEKAGDLTFIEEVKNLEPELIVVIAYGQILKQALIDIPSTAIINLHASLLPKYRGAACIQAAIDAGDKQSGMTVMHVVKALDAGDVILQKSIPITSQSTGGSLHNELAEQGPEVLMEAIAQLADGSSMRLAQKENQVTYISKLLRNDGEIDWSDTAEKIERRIRAYHPWPGTFTTFQDGKGKVKRLKVFPFCEEYSVDDDVFSTDVGQIVMDESGVFVTTGSGKVSLNEVQPEGGRRMSFGTFLNGSKVEKLG